MQEVLDEGLMVISALGFECARGLVVTKGMGKCRIGPNEALPKSLDKFVLQAN